MSNSVNQDPEPSKTTVLDKSSAMTIEFLRARLLSERSVSKSARQRADELAKRVAELEEQLNFVSLQRKKAEKATADVLAILENRGIRDVSEEFDSNSEHDETPHDFKPDNGSLTTKEVSVNTKSRSKEAEAYSSSEIESSPSTGRSLSWKSSKDPQHSLEKEKYIESVRRRASFTSNSSSARRVGKSCRRVRRRETRSMGELQNDGSEKTMRSADVSNYSDNGSVALREGSGFDNSTGQQESTELGPDSETQKANGHYYSGHERDEDMESALQHQAQLIDQYEEEEKAQREWEEKFRESNNGTQESGDPGNHSDVTEERYEIELPSCAAEPSKSDDPKMEQKQTDALSYDESLISDADKGRKLDEKSNGGVESSSPGEFSFPLTKEKSIQQFSAKSEASSPLPDGKSVHVHVHAPQSRIPNAIPGTSPLLHLAVVPQQTSTNIGPVLEALERAKLSLNQRLHSLGPVAREASVSTIRTSNPDTHYMGVSPVPGLFRLPTDAQFEATGAGTGPGTQLTETAPGGSLSGPYVPSTSMFSSDLFRTAPYSSFTPEFSPGLKSLSQPRPSNHLNPHSLIEGTYPYLPDITLPFRSSESFRPNMRYR